MKRRKAYQNIAGGVCLLFISISISQYIIHRPKPDNSTANFLTVLPIVAFGVSSFLTWVFGFLFGLFPVFLTYFARIAARAEENFGWLGVFIIEDEK